MRDLVVYLEGQVKREEGAIISKDELPKLLALIHSYIGVEGELCLYQDKLRSGLLSAVDGTASAVVHEMYDRMAEQRLEMIDHLDIVHPDLFKDFKDEERPR